MPEVSRGISVRLRRSAWVARDIWAGNLGVVRCGPALRWARRAQGHTPGGRISEGRDNSFEAPSQARARLGSVDGAPRRNRRLSGGPSLQARPNGYGGTPRRHQAGYPETRYPILAHAGGAIRRHDQQVVRIIGRRGRSVRTRLRRALKRRIRSSAEGRRRERREHGRPGSSVSAAKGTGPGSASPGMISRGTASSILDPILVGDQPFFAKPAHGLAPQGGRLVIHRGPSEVVGSNPTGGDI